VKRVVQLQAGEGLALALWERINRISAGQLHPAVYDRLGVT